MDLDLSEEKMYWTDFGTNKIRRANLDGTNVEDLISGTVLGLRGISLDLSAQKMYWSDVRSDTIERANLDGSGREVLPLVSDDPQTIDIAGGELYLKARSVEVTVERIEIDASPHSRKSIINPRSRGRIWVAVLSETDPDSPFDPSSQVDIPTVEFGPDGAKVERYKVKDINKDGLGDLLLRFKVRETGIACGDTEATLTGETFSGLNFTGTDSIKTVGCKPKEHHKKKHHNKHYDDDRNDDKRHHGKRNEKKYHNRHHDDDRDEGREKR